MGPSMPYRRLSALFTLSHLCTLYDSAYVPSMSLRALSLSMRSLSRCCSSFFLFCARSLTFAPSRLVISSGMLRAPARSHWLGVSQHGHGCQAVCDDGPCQVISSQFWATTKLRFSCHRPKGLVGIRLASHLCFMAIGWHSCISQGMQLVRLSSLLHMAHAKGLTLSTEREARA
eukprot:82951-Pleurochrysis_carterae.AAC.3